MAIGPRKRPDPRAQRPPKGAPVTMMSVDGIQLPPGLLGKLSAGQGIDGCANCNVTYGMFSIPKGGAGQCGTLVITRTVHANGGTLKLSMSDEQCTGHTHKLSATMRCRRDTLSTPTMWSWTEEMYAENQPVAFTRLAKSGASGQGQVTTRDVCGERVTRVGPAFTVNWALFDAVGRLPREPFDPIAFDLIDHFDQFKPNHTLHYRSSQQVKLGQKSVRLHLFDHLGFGILPWTYFVNDHGLMVLAVGGLQAYGMLEARQTKAGEQ